MKIDDVRTYNVQIYGWVEETDINPTSPLWLTVAQKEETSTWVTLQTDQSGLVGLIRHLHGLGLVLISMSRGMEDLQKNISIHSGDK